MYYRDNVSVEVKVKQPTETCQQLSINLYCQMTAVAVKHVQDAALGRTECTIYEHKPPLMQLMIWVQTQKELILQIEPLMMTR